MNKTRLEAFSDGVLAIIITIMVLELKVPHDASWSSLKPLIPVFLSYVTSFLLIGIYWGNHHHLLHGAKTVNSGIILSNLNLLFWLSLVPAATGWMGENHFAPNTIILYAILLILCGLAYGILQNKILKAMDHQSELKTAIKKQGKKVILTFIIDLSAIPFAFIHPYISGLMFVLQSAIWLIPDKNIEKALKNTT
ncbi:MAG: TMEM175 family protein [Chitinophagaceae bacterium]